MSRVNAEAGWLPSALATAYAELKERYKILTSDGLDGWTRTRSNSVSTNSSPN